MKSKDVDHTGIVQIVKELFKLFNSFFCEHRTIYISTYCQINIPHFTHSGNVYVITIHIKCEIAKHCEIENLNKQLLCGWGESLDLIIDNRYQISSAVFIYVHSVCYGDKSMKNQPWQFDRSSEDKDDKKHKE